MNLPARGTFRSAALIGLPSAVVGVLIGLSSRSIRTIVVTEEITAGEILNAVVTVVIAVLVADYLARRTASLRFEKDVLITDCTDVQRAAAAVRDFARRSRLNPGTADSRREVLRLLESAFIALEALETDLAACQDSLGNLVNVMPVVTTLIAYKAALTGGIFPHQALDEKTYIRSEKKFASCAKAIAALRFELNRR